MTIEQKENYRDFARHLAAALIAHRLRISFAYALKHYVDDGSELAESWYELAEGIERSAVERLNQIFDSDSNKFVQ